MGDRRRAIEFYNEGVKVELAPPTPQSVQLRYQLYSSAAMTDPTMAEAWFKVGVTNAELNHLAAAVATWRRTLELAVGDASGDLTKERQAHTLVNIGHRLYHMGRVKEAKEYTMAALSMNSDLSLAWCNLSMIQMAQGDSEESVKSARKAFDMDSNPTNEMQLAMALMFSGIYDEGLKHFESRFAYRLKDFLTYPYPVWDGEEGKTLFLMADQGIGDTLSFARFLPAAAKRCKFIHAIVQAELLRFFRAAFQTILNVDFLPMGSTAFLPADCWSTFVSLPHHLGMTTEEIIRCPGIPMLGFAVPKTWKATDRKLHIGVAWHGSPLNDNNKWRSFPIEQLLELYRVPGIQLYSLQVGERAKDIHDAGAAVLIRDLSPYIRDTSDTMAIIRDLDLVITCESALGHIAGACNAECWIPLSWVSDYRMQGAGSIWYPKHRMFKQSEPGMWPPVFERIITELHKRV